MNALFKADIIVARFLVMCLFLPPHLQVFIAIGTCLYFVTRTIATKQLPARNIYLWALLLGSGYLLYVLALPFTPAPYRHAVGGFCERRAAYLLLPFVFATIAQPFRQLILGQLMYFVYGCIIVCALSNLDFLYHHFYLNHGVDAIAHVRYRIMFEFFTGIHPTYMSIYLSFGLCIVLLTGMPDTRMQRVVKYVIIYLLLLFMLALFAKSPLIALGIIAIHYLYSQRHELHKFKWVFVASAAVLAGAYFFIPFLRQRAMELVSLFGKDGSENITQNSVHIRKLIWSTDTKMLEHYWLTGTGPGRILDLLHQRYFFHSLYRGYWVGYFDPHNQYFFDWLAFGLAGIGLLLIVLFVQFRRAIVAGNSLYLYLLIIISVTFFTETLLARQQGVLFYSIFTSLLFFAAGKSRQAS